MKIKTLEEISKCKTPNIRGGFTKACEDINAYIWRNGSQVLPLYLEKWLQSEGKLSYQTRGNELALVSKTEDVELIMLITDGLLEEVKMFSKNNLFEHHTKETTWYFQKGIYVYSKKVEMY